MHQDIHFSVLGVPVTLSGPSRVIEPIAVAYGRFRVRSPAETGGASVAFVPGEPGAIRVGARELPLIPGLDPTLQLYEQFLSALMDRVESHAVMHAAALVGPDGGALLLAAPAGHGKSSLCLELLARGFSFLSDDSAPLDLATGRVSPYPRRVGVSPGGSAPIPEVFRRAATDPDAPRLFGKTLLDVGHVLGEDRLARASAPLGHVILLTPGPPETLEPASSWVEIAARAEAAERLEHSLAGVPGVEIALRRDLDGVVVWRARLVHASRPTAAVSAIFEDEAVLYAQKFWDSRPDFSARPTATRISRLDAAGFLGREVLNRRSRGRLLARYGGSVIEMFVDLAGAMQEATCFGVSVGRFREVADLVESLVLGDRSSEIRKPSPGA